MRTPREYSTLLNRGIVTPEMIASVLYSFNKRVKNIKEKDPAGYKKTKEAWKRSGSEPSGPAVTDAGTAKIVDYYAKKDFLLITLCTPTVRHIIGGKEYYCYRVHNSEFHFPGYAYARYGLSPPEGLETKEVTDFKILGEETERLLSLNFCNKVFDLVKSGEYVLADAGACNGKK